MDRLLSQGDSDSAPALAAPAVTSGTDSCRFSLARVRALSPQPPQTVAFVGSASNRTAHAVDRSRRFAIGISDLAISCEIDFFSGLVDREHCRRSYCRLGQRTLNWVRPVYWSNFETRLSMLASIRRGRGAVGRGGDRHPLKCASRRSTRSSVLLVVTSGVPFEVVSRATSNRGAEPANRRARPVVERRCFPSMHAGPGARSGVASAG
jgi:hypothetical protein